MSVSQGSNYNTVGFAHTVACVLKAIAPSVTPPASHPPLQVPYQLGDDELRDDWQCRDNVWDEGHASCAVPQAQSNEEIDHILALQDDELAEAAYAREGQQEGETHGEGPQDYEGEG